MINNIIDQLKRDEGFRSNIYIDTVGKRTIGYGHNLDANPIHALVVPISEALAAQILGTDVERISTHLITHLPWVTTLNEARLGILQNMSFNMGVIGLLGFHHMLSYLQSGDYPSAAYELRKSEWADQVGDRSIRLFKQMLSGIWQ